MRQERKMNKCKSCGIKFKGKVCPNCNTNINDGKLMVKKDFRKVLKAEGPTNLISKMEINK